MSLLKELKPQRFFYYFEQISAIPHGSGNMKGIADFCEDFARRYNLEYKRDKLDNVIIYKPASIGYENAEPIILQAHLDMVCQKSAESNFDFEKDALKLYVDGDFLKAEDTTLGGDDGAGVAIMLSILESNTICHPAIEAVFTIDEETGMNGAKALDISLLKGRRMINLDGESNNVIVSCAGGSDFEVRISKNSKRVSGTKLTLTLSGLKGGHSGIEINKNRVNASILMGRVLNSLAKENDFEIIQINGGDKPNAITPICTAELCVNNANNVLACLNEILCVIADEISSREPNFNYETEVFEKAEYLVFDTEVKNKLIYTLLLAPNGVCEMSAEIDGLVQTSLNLGILKTQENEILLHFNLRSNKKSSLQFLEEKLEEFFNSLGVTFRKFGHYPPWEFNSNSTLQQIYCNCYKEVYGSEALIKAIHAGLECGVFDDKINDFECIAVGPCLYDVHTVNERLSISSTQTFYELLLKVLENLK